jgi:diguanylate cyclase
MHGHAAGDAVLRGVAKLLRRRAREMDLVARYGGEEFALILPGTDLEKASHVAVRACESIQEACFHHAGKVMHVTASFGVAEVTQGDGCSTLVARADKALYAAKEGGRNRVCHHTGAHVQWIGSARPTDPAGPPTDHASRALSRDATTDDSASRRSAGKGVSPPTTDAPHTDSATYPLASRSTFCQQVRNRTAEWQRGGPTFSVILAKAATADSYDADSSSSYEQSAHTVLRNRVLAACDMEAVGQYAPNCLSLLLPTATLAEAMRVASQLRAAVAHVSSLSAGTGVAWTLSIGVAEITEQDDFISLLRRAEAALNEASRPPGGRVYYHDGAGCVPLATRCEAAVPGV